MIQVLELSGSLVPFTLFAQSGLTLCNCSMPGLPVHCQLPECTQTPAHWVSDDIQPSHPLSSSSLPAFNLSQHQSLFKWVSSSHQVAKVLEFQLQYQSFQWIFRTSNEYSFRMDWLNQFFKYKKYFQESKTYSLNFQQKTGLWKISKLIH